MTAVEMKKERDQLRKSIGDGKIKGRVALKKARGRMYYLNGELKKKGDEQLTKAVKKAVHFNPRQGFLPGILESIDKVRIEELVADRIFQALAKGLGREALDLDAVVDKVFKVAK